MLYFLRHHDPCATRSLETMWNETQLEYSPLQDIANKLRIHSIESTSAAKSGHPTSCSSIAEIMSVLFFHTMRYKVSEPKDPANDRLVLSKGHAAPILYASWAEAGLFPVEDLKNLRKINSDLEGHPTPRLNFVDVATGSLGQGLGVAAGMAYVGKNFDKANYRVYCVVGDGEAAEGSIWESAHFASHYRLDNLCVIFDINRLGQSEETSLGHDIQAYKARLESFGFQTIVVDGHNVKELVKAFDSAFVIKDKPTAILAKTFKGKNFPNIEDTSNWHGKPLGDQSQEVIEHLTSLIRSNHFKIQLNEPKEEVKSVDITNIRLSSPPDYEIGQMVATRTAYGEALVKIARNNSRVIGLDGDVKNSTFSDKLKTFESSRFIECFIAEQNLVGVAIGATCRDRTVAFVSTFAAFLTRAFDQIRMAAISQSNVNFVGSHCGVSIGEDGPSQMGLEDIAMFRSLPGSTVFYPSDAVACERAVELAANAKGITFIRTTRPSTPIIYTNNHSFQIGRANVIRASSSDQVLVIGAGITLSEVLAAADELAKEDIFIRILDLFTIKPIDKNTIIKSAAETGGRIITVEDHYPEGGLGEAVASAVAEERDIIVKQLAIPEVPRSGGSKALLEIYGISSAHIIEKVYDILKL